ncbi:hypothetical protein R1flu_026985 [Riccia fluitans]|uniref:HNH nuclease domain-containing protein n=1 Tax=Riccia fluitans TaxID=41844 RepID=A0ABD1XHI3_9MARC
MKSNQRIGLVSSGWKKDISSSTNIGYDRTGHLLSSRTTQIFCLSPVSCGSDWDFRNLVVLPIGRRVEHENHVTDDFHADGDHETLSNMLVVGDVFAMKANDEEMEYWLLRCIARKHKIIEKEVRCSWNTKHIFTRDEVVVYGKYFEF